MTEWVFSSIFGVARMWVQLRAKVHALALFVQATAARAGGLDACTDARDASTSTQRSAKCRITQRTTIAGLFPSSCRLSSLGFVAVGGRMTPVCCPTGGGSVQ
jgi:hypothetical protein